VTVTRSRSPVGKRGARAQRTARLRRRIAVASVALVLVSWNAVDVLGTRGGATVVASSSLGGPGGGSVDVVAPVVSRQS
jgi:hypothetical protein